MPSDELNEQIRCEWLELGFYYDLNEDSKSWQLFGSILGLKKFALLLREYAVNPENDCLSEHEHFGPYLSLEIGTWLEPDISDHWIAGPLSKILNLADTIDNLLKNAKPGQHISLRNHFAPDQPWDIVLYIEADDFDPSTKDPSLSSFENEWKINK
jgi:hypothetical protein